MTLNGRIGLLTTATWPHTPRARSSTSPAPSASTRPCRWTARPSIGCSVMTGVGAVINTAAVPPGASMAVFGVGGVGLNVVQGGALVAAHPIIAVDVVAAKLDHARALGATHLVDASREDPVAAIRRLTGRGADFTFVAVGATRAVGQAIEALSPGGTCVLIGVPESGATRPARRAPDGDRRARRSAARAMAARARARTCPGWSTSTWRASSDRRADQPSLWPRRGQRGFPGARGGRARARLDRVFVTTLTRRRPEAAMRAARVGLGCPSMSALVPTPYGGGRPEMGRSGGPSTSRA